MRYIMLQKFKFILLTIFYVVSEINSFINMIYRNDRNDLAYVLPLIFAALYFIVLVINYLNFLVINNKDEGFRHIKDKYPVLWEKVFSGGLAVMNPLSTVMVNFLKGEFDEGNDEVIQSVKKIFKRDLYIHILAALLIPVVWFTNLFFMFIKL